MSEITPRDYSLQDFMDEVDTPPVRADGAMVLHTTSHADWAARKVIRAQDDLKRAERDVLNARAKIDEWITAKRHAVAEHNRFFFGPLREWLTRAIAGGKAKSEKLPSGLVGMRKVPPEIIRDDNAVIAWLDAAGIADEFTETVTVRKLKWGALKAHLKLDVDGAAIFTRQDAYDPTGEVIESIQVVTKPDDIYVKSNALPELPEGEEYAELQ